MSSNRFNHPLRYHRTYKRNKMSNNFNQIIGIFLLAILGAFVIALFMALPMYLLWNWLFPELFHLKEITLSQALGLSLFCSLFFKSSASSSK